MYARQLEPEGRTRAAFGRIAEGRKVGSRDESPESRESGGGAATTIIKAGFEDGHFRAEGKSLRKCQDYLQCHASTRTKRGRERMK